jgi:MFS family permease
MVGLDRIDAQGLSQLIAAFLLLMTLLAAIPSGMLGDRFGKKNVLLVGLLLVGVFALLSAFATRVPQLLFYLVFLGLGNGARIVLFLPYLAELIPHERVGEFTGLTAFAETGGVFLSITLAGELLNLNLFDLQYRLVFVVTGVFLLLGAVALCFVKSRLPPVEADRMAHETPLT